MTDERLKLIRAHAATVRLWWGTLVSEMLPEGPRTQAERDCHALVGYVEELLAEVAALGAVLGDACLDSRQAERAARLRRALAGLVEESERAVPAFRDGGLPFPERLVDAARRGRQALAEEVST